MLLLLCGESSEGLMALMALVISGKHKLEQQMCKITHPSILPSQVLIRVFRPVDCKSPRLSIHQTGCGQWYIKTTCAAIFGVPGIGKEIPFSLSSFSSSWLEFRYNGQIWIL
jgi:hypothetical protein